MSFDDVLLLDLLVRLLYVLKQHCITHIVVKILKPTQQPQTQSHPKLPAITWFFTIFLLTFLTKIQSPGQQPPPSLYIHLTKHISESMAALGGSYQDLDTWLISMVIRSAFSVGLWEPFLKIAIHDGDPNHAS